MMSNFESIKKQRYGYVTLDDVPTLLEQHIGKGKIVEYLWRGQMGLPEEDQQKAQHPRLQSSEGTNSRRTVTQNSSKLPEISTPACGPRADANGCYRANGNGTCCQLSAAVEKDDNFDGNGKRKVCDDTYAAVAVVCAAVSVGVAYRCYKRL